MPVQIVGGAIQRVNNPFKFGALVAQYARFFRQNPVVRIGFLQGFDDDGFGLAVHFGNEIVKRFVVDADAGKIVAGAQHHVACLAGGFECNVERGVELLGHGVSY